MKNIGISLVLAGGVSLGSFEAGVIAELLYALNYLNKVNSDRQYKLDVLTGSSAGALTSALAAKTAICGYDKTSRNLYNAWVKEISINSLMSESSDNAVLSKDIINQIADKYILINKSEEIRPSSYAPETIYLNFALSNMRGIDYSIKYKNSDNSFVTTIFSDNACFKINITDSNIKKTWNKIKSSAIASGNFPVAFKPEMLERNIKDYPGYDQNTNGQLPEQMAFLDGGIFNNEPMKEAIRLSAIADGGYIDGERIFILVDPNINNSIAEDFDVETRLSKQVQRLCSMVIGECTARDWLKTNRLSNNIKWKDELVEILINMLSSSNIDRAEEVNQNLQDLSEKIFDYKKNLFPERYKSINLEKHQELSINRYKDQKEKFKIASDPKNQDIFRNLIYVLDNISSLRNKAIIEPNLIGCSGDDVAGENLFAFGGFFDEKWRDHDYKKGRIQAHKMLPSILGVESYEQEKTSDGSVHSDYLIPEELKVLKDAIMHECDKQSRIEFRNLLIKRFNAEIDTVLNNFITNKLLRGLTRVYLLPLKHFFKNTISGKDFLQLKMK